MRHVPLGLQLGLDIPLRQAPVKRGDLQKDVLGLCVLHCLSDAAHFAFAAQICRRSDFLAGAAAGCC
jgi:hypothetical protein